ncbi:MAG: hypothetical protein EXR07_13875 [Acetobacteraceae bacterium]|nr:hypothetical protein [Acetobacteraceae bacterium]
MPAPGAAIDAQTFRATYGFMGTDITARLLQHARITSQELAADNVAIPPGTHKVTLKIADSQGRENSQSFEFTVA